MHDKRVEWGHDPRMLGTTRVRQIGVGQHKRKNDAIDAEVIALAVDARLPEAHVLSPECRALRAQLSVRGALVETRSQSVTTIRGLARAAGVLLPSCDPESFLAKLEKSDLDDSTRALVAPLVTILRTLDTELARVEQALSGFAERDPILNLCATVPGVGLIVAATYVSVIDDAKRFKNANAVGAYLGLVPSEATTGGPDKRRLGSITKRGKRITVVALARKLAGVLWAMWRDGTVYDGAVQAEQTAGGVRDSARQQQHRADVLERAAKKLQRKAGATDPQRPARRVKRRADSSEMSTV